MKGLARSSLVPVFFCACGMTDAPFSEGFGSVRGWLEGPGGPAVAEVTIAGTSLSATSAADGSFSIEKVPAGLREVVALERAGCLAGRARARVAAGAVSDAGRIELSEAGGLRVMVADPDLPIEGAGVSLVELPLLSAGTDADGEAVFSCLPAGMCLSARVDFCPLPFSFEEAGACLVGAETRLSLAPEAGYGLKVAQALNALRLVALLLRPLEACSASCRLPDWWDAASGPPCPGPVGDSTTQQEEDNLRNTLMAVRSLSRFTIKEAESLGCDSSGGAGFECRAGRCAEAPAQYPLEIVWQGEGNIACLPAEKNIVVVEKAEDLYSVADCLGVAKPFSGGPFIVFRYGLDLEINGAFSEIGSYDRYSIFLEASFGETTSIFSSSIRSFVILEVLSRPPDFAEMETLVSIVRVLAP